MAVLLKLFTMLVSSRAVLALVVSSRLTPHEKTAENMRNDPSYLTQLMGCLSFGVDSSNKAAQDIAAREGVIDAIAHAMDLFPERKELIMACTRNLATVTLFNRENGLRAGQLGALNHTLHTYMQNMDDPMVMSMGGDIGAYFDYVDENRLIARELGGIQAIIQNIKNHFHGTYGEWSYNLVKQSLFALSSGCWVNQDICYNEGFPELAVALMAEHGHETKIAEETQQVTKSLIAKSEGYRQRLADLGITDSMVHVMKVNAHDRGAIDLTCENFACLVGPKVVSGPGAPPAQRVYNENIQLKALDSGALQEVIKVVTSGQEMHHNEHSGFNFDIDSAYNVNRDCFFALASFGYENLATQAAMSQAGLADIVLADLHKHPTDSQETEAGCLLLRQLDHNMLLATDLTEFCP